MNGLKDKVCYRSDPYKKRDCCKTRYNYWEKITKPLYINVYRYIFYSLTDRTKEQVSYLPDEKIHKKPRKS